MRRRNLLLLWTALFLGALAIAGVGNMPFFNAGGFSSINAFFAASLHPDLDKTFLMILGNSAITTFWFALGGMMFSLVFGFLGGILSSRFFWKVVQPTKLGYVIWFVFRLLFSIPRAIHEVIWGLFFLSVIGLDPIVGILAIGIPFAAMTAKVFSEILDQVPEEPVWAIVNSGGNRFVAFVYAAIIQALPNLMSYSFYRFECALRSAAVLGVIGAGGIGFQIQLSLQSLRYSQLWTGFYVLILLCALVDFLSSGLRRRFGFVGRTQLSERQNALVNLRSRFLKWFFIGLGLFALVSSVFFLPINFSKWIRFPRLFLELYGQIQLENVVESFSASSLVLAVDTVAMSILAISTAGLFGILFSFPALVKFRENERKISPGNLLYFVSRLLLLFMRAVPTPIIALIILYGIYPSILPGAIALAIHNIGILGRLNGEVTEHTKREPLIALRASGASFLEVIFYGVMPENIRLFLSYILYRWEVCMRETVMVGLVGAGGLGLLLNEQLSGFDYNGLLGTLVIFIMLAMIVDGLSSIFRASFR